MRRKVAIIGALVLVLALLLTLAPACGDEEEEIKVERIKWGIMETLSGPAAAWECLAG